MLSAECCEEPPGLLTCLRPRMHQLQVLTFRRAARRPCDWFPRKLLIEAAAEETLQDLCAVIGRGIERASAGRPRSLLVLLNPNSGHRQGRRVWRRLAEPVLAAASIKTRVWETCGPGHASEMVAGLTAQQLQGIDGIVCVGGDGVFHEALNGLMAARGSAAATGDAELAALLGALRLAHIPAGSTDAVACTLHGTRRAFTAALHVALGDSTPLDVLRVDTPQGPKFASCIAAYGFLADVTSEAERWRWMGPLRYDVVGAAKLAVSRAYPARIRYLEGEVARSLSKHAHTVCTSDCGVCRAASLVHAARMSQRHLAAASAPPALCSSSASCDGASAQDSPCLRQGRESIAGLPATGSSGSLGSSAGAHSEPHPPALQRNAAAGAAAPGPVEPGGAAAAAVRAAATAAGKSVSLGATSSCSEAHIFLRPAAEAGERHAGEGWQEITGEFCSIMLIVMPCRSDKTRSGMARFGHLADGRVKLVLVRKCSPLQYLRFLHSMSRHGCAPGQLPHVTVLDAVAVEVTPLGGSSGGVGSVGSPTSCWNLDGELVAGPDIQAEVHPGLVRVFSRGVEQA
ncbi:hypothetical protein ABPG77_004786 [Micractinium sp. CCAP 211/92]